MQMHIMRPRKKEGKIVVEWKFLITLINGRSPARTEYPPTTITYIPDKKKHAIKQVIENFIGERIKANINIAQNILTDLIPSRGCGSHGRDIVQRHRFRRPEGIDRSRRCRVREVWKL